jgi:chromate reductase
MRILALSGSLRARSSNTALLRAAAALAPADMEISFYTGLADLPLFSPDLDNESTPPAVQNLRAQLQAAQGVIICTPEYAYGMPGALKNALDWTVSSGEFYGKPTAVISASPSASGGEKAMASLLLTLTALAAAVEAGATLVVPFVGKKLNAHDQVTDPETTRALRAVLEALAHAILAHAASA